MDVRARRSQGVEDVPPDDAAQGAADPLGQGDVPQSEAPPFERYPALHRHPGGSRPLQILSGSRPQDPGGAGEQLLSRPVLLLPAAASLPAAFREEVADRTADAPLRRS